MKINKLTFVNPNQFLKAALYVYSGALSKPYTLHATPVKTHPFSLQLLEDGSIVKQFGNESRQDIVREMPRPLHGLLTACIAAAYAAYIAYGDKKYQSLTKEELARVQLLLLFKEVGRTSPLKISKQERERSATEFEKYCEHHSIYTHSEELKQDMLTLKEIDEHKKQKNLLSKLISEADKTIIAALTKSAEQCNEYLKSLLKEVGLLQACEGIYDKKLFDFYHGDSSNDKNRDVLLLLKTLAEHDISQPTLNEQNPDVKYAQIQVNNAIWFSPTAFYNLHGNEKVEER